MYKNLAVLLLVFGAVLTQVTSAQESDTLWSRVLGGANGEGAYAIESTSDGAFIVAGEKETTYYGPTDVYLLKIDGNGDTLWTRTFGDANTSELGRSVQQTFDGGFIIAGYAGIGEHNQVYLLKTDFEGNFEWDALYGITPDNRGHCVKQTSDGGYIIAGQAYIIRGPFGSYDSYIIKTNAQGGVEWERVFGGEMNEYSLTVTELQGGGFVAGGRTQSFGVWDAYLIRLSPYGDSLWARAVGGAAADEATDIMELPDQSGFVFSGISVAPSRGDADFYLARTDTIGAIVWSRRYGGIEDDDAQSLVMTPDGGFILTGMTSSYGPDGWNVYVVRTDPVGVQLWSRVLGGSGDDRGHGITQHADGSFAVAGWTTSFGNGWLDLWMIKFQGSPTSIAEEIVLPIPAGFTLSQNYPNPFNARTVISYSLNSETEVSLNIYSVTGELVGSPLDRAKYQAGDHAFVWDGTNRIGKAVSTGVYFYELRVGERKETKSMALIK